MGERPLLSCPAPVGDEVSSPTCLHNLRDVTRIREVYRDIRAHLKPGGVFPNEDLINAPTAELPQRYEAVAVARRHRAGASAQDLWTMGEGKRVCGECDHGSLSGDPGPTPRSEEGGRVHRRGLLLEGPATGRHQRIRLAHN